MTAASTARAGRTRVLQVIGNAIVGGMETFVARLCDQLTRTGDFEIVCLCPYESPATHALRALGCDVHVAPIPDEPVWRGIEYGVALVADEGIDVIHAHLTNAHLLAGLVGKLSDTPVLATIHGRDVLAPDIAMQRLAGTHLHVVSRATLYQAIAAGVRRDRVTCILNGVDADRFAPGVSNGRLRATCGIADDVPLIGFVGRLSPEKGPELFVRSMALALMRLPDAHAVMIGDGPSLVGVTELAAELGIDGRLHVVGVRDDIPDCLRAMTVLVSTSHSEGTPLSIMEAQATGVPVVATHVGGVPEIVTMGETGVLVAPGEADAIAGVVVALCDRPTRCAELGIAARERMVERFSLRARNAEIGALLKTLAGSQASTFTATRAAGIARIHPNGAGRNGPVGGDAVPHAPVDR